MGVVKLLLVWVCICYWQLVPMEPPPESPADSDEVTAIYQSTDSPASSPGNTLRTNSFDNLLVSSEEELAQTPRMVTSFLYAVMDRFTIDPHNKPPLIAFPDYLGGKELQTITLPIASTWIQLVRRVLHNKVTREELLVNPRETRVDVRDLQWAQKQFLVFWYYKDFVDPDILLKNYNPLLRQTRKMRIEAFAQQNVQVLVGSQYHSVQYRHLGSPDEEYPPPEKYKCGNCLCTIL